MRKRILCTALAIFLILGESTFRVATAAEQVPIVKVVLIVDAPVPVVFDVIRAKLCFDNVRKLSSVANLDVCEEKDNDLPVIGHASCVFEETYTPFGHITYHMTKSDRFKTFEGSWDLEKQGNKTKLELHSSADVGLRYPFWREITQKFLMGGALKRINTVKKAAEAEQKTITARNPIVL